MSRATVYKSSIKKSDFTNTRMTHYNFSKTMIDKKSLTSSRNVAYGEREMGLVDDLLTKCNAIKKEEDFTSSQMAPEMAKA